uniref:Gustatory receptor n=1 Tax=Stomoxys calcitrans TaxID=35570 RepID=A0A1I8PGU4_STOCA
MATHKTEAALNRRQLPSRPLLEEFSLLFYIGKIWGINAQDFQEFRNHKHLEKSLGGNCLVIVITVCVFICFNLMVWVFHDPEYSVEKDIFTVALALILTYFSLAVYLTDRYTHLRTQDQLMEIFDTLHDLDDDLMELGIEVDNSPIRYRILLQIVFASICESLVFLFTFAFLVSHDSWTSGLWIFTAVPTYCNALDKIWYNTIVLAIKKRFEIINAEFDNMALEMQHQASKKIISMPVFSVEKESNRKIHPRKMKVQPSMIPSYNQKGILNDSRNKPKKEFLGPKSNIDLNMPSSGTGPIFNEMLENRFEKICQLHNELCVMGVELNGIWSVPILALMAYGFLMVTAQLYFFYCATVNQIIPSLFRPANSLVITIIFLLYVSVKCFSILMLSWLTNLESKKSGVCIHRCATAADNGRIYEMVNHLSLKLFNHAVDFNASGYFSLDMDTLFGFLGGISTYLIILIQFNIEQQQVRSAAASGGLATANNDESIAKTIAENATELFTQMFATTDDISASQQFQ